MAWRRVSGGAVAVARPSGYAPVEPMATALGIVWLIAGLVVVAAVGSRHRLYLAPVLAAFALRAALAVIDDQVYRLPGQDDSARFDYFGWYWARNGQIWSFERVTSGAELYTWIVGAFYSVFDRSRLMMQAVNVLLGALIVVNVARLTHALSGDGPLSLKAAWLTAAFPSLIYFSAVMLREVAVAYPLTLSVLHAALWLRDRRLLHLVVAIGAWIVSLAFHSGVLAAGVGIALWFLLDSTRSAASGRFGASVRNGAAVLGAAALLVLLWRWGFGLEKLQGVATGQLEALSAAQSGYASGRTVYLEDVHAESTLELTWQAPLRLVYFLFAPFPWMLSAPSDAVGVVDSAFFLTLLISIARNRRRFAELPRAGLVFSVFGTMAVTFAMGVSNYGTALRHRSKMLPLLVAVTCALPLRRASGAVAPIRQPRTVPPISDATVRRMVRHR